MTIFWHVTPCSFVEDLHRVGGTRYLLLRSRPEVKNVGSSTRLRTVKFQTASVGLSVCLTKCSQFSLHNLKWVSDCMGEHKLRGLRKFNWRGGFDRKMDKNYTVRGFCICVRILLYIIAVIQSKRKRRSEHVKRV